MVEVTFKDLIVDLKENINRFLERDDLLALAQTSSVDFVIALYILAVKFKKPFDENFATVFSKCMRVLLLQPKLFSGNSDLADLYNSLIDRIKKEALFLNIYAIRMLPYIYAWELKNKGETLKKTDIARMINLVKLFSYHSQTRMHIEGFLYQFAPVPTTTKPAEQITLQHDLHKQAQELIYVPKAFSSHDRQSFLEKNWHPRSPFNILTAVLTPQEKSWLKKLLQAEAKKTDDQDSIKDAISLLYPPESNMVEAFNNFFEAWLNSDSNGNQNSSLGASPLMVLIHLVQNSKHHALLRKFADEFIVQINRVFDEKTFSVKVKTNKIVKLLGEMAPLVTKSIDPHAKEILVELILQLSVCLNMNDQTKYDSSDDSLEKMKTIKSLIYYLDVKNHEKILPIIMDALQRASSLFNPDFDSEISYLSYEIHLMTAYFLESAATKNLGCAQMAQNFAARIVHQLQNSDINDDTNLRPLFLLFQYLGSLAGFLSTEVENNPLLIDNIIQLLRERALPQVEEPLETIMYSATHALIIYAQNKNIRKWHPELSRELVIKLKELLPVTDSLDPIEDELITGPLGRVLVNLIEDQEDKVLVEDLLMALSERTKNISNFNFRFIREGFNLLIKILPLLYQNPEYIDLAHKVVSFLLEQAHHEFKEGPWKIYAVEALEKYALSIDANNPPEFFGGVILTLQENFSRISLPAQILVIKHVAPSNIDYFIQALLENRMFNSPTQKYFDNRIHLLTVIAMLYPEKSEEIVRTLEENLTPLKETDFTKALATAAPECIPRTKAACTI